MDNLKIMIRDYLIDNKSFEDINQEFSYYFNVSECIDVIWHKHMIRYDKRISTLSLIAWVYVNNKK